MLETVLLRFRDFRERVDTISVHLTLLSQYSTVWWAWWKKDTEPERTAELNELTKRLNLGPVRIGIFDRSTDRFFVAILHRCVHGSGSKLDCPAPSQTPEYVRDSQMAAWFEISGLEGVAREVFVREFGGIPPSDCSLFPVVRLGRGRTSLPREVPPPPSATADWKQLSGSVALHLSDLHFGEDFGYPQSSGPGRRRLIDIIVEDVERAAITPNDIAFVVVSGDLTTKGNPEPLFEQARGFLVDLCDRFAIEEERVLIVPGNHDFRLLQWNPENYSHENGFLGFLAGFYGIKIEALPDVYRCKLGNGLPIEILLINSVRVRHEKDRHYGYVGWDRYEGIMAKSPKPQDAIRIGVLHHHLLSTTQEEEPNAEWNYGNVSVTIDAGRVTDALQRHQFRLILHGHQHIPAVARVARGRRKNESPTRLDGLGRTIYLVAAGSAGAIPTRLSREFPYNSYNILRFSPHFVDVEARQFTTAPVSQRAWRCKLPL